MDWATPPFTGVGVGMEVGGVSCSPAPQDTVLPPTLSPSDDPWYLFLWSLAEPGGPHLLPQLTHPPLCSPGCYKPRMVGLPDCTLHNPLGSAEAGSPEGQQRLHAPSRTVSPHLASSIGSVTLSEETYNETRFTTDTNEN